MAEYSHINKKMLIGSTFPTSLIHRKVIIEPKSLANLKKAIETSEIHSFWGHNDTLADAKEITGVDLSPLTPRPALTLNNEGYPTLDGIIFNECWILAPEFPLGYRPGLIDAKVKERITGWYVLHITWTEV